MKQILLLAIGLVKTVVPGFYVEDGAIVVRVRPYVREAGRCPMCGAKRSGYDRGADSKRWRAMDLGQSMCWLEYGAQRVRGSEHDGKTYYEGIPAQNVMDAIESALPVIGRDRALAAADSALRKGYITKAEHDDLLKKPA